MASIFIMKFCGSLALLCASCLADGTLNKVGCGDVAYVQDDKYVSCSLDASVKDQVKNCLNSSSSAFPPANATVQWRIRGRIVPDPEDKTLPSLNVPRNGVLHYNSVSLTYPENNKVSCIYVNKEGEMCEPWTSINLIVYISGYDSFKPGRRPTIFTDGIRDTDRVAVVGKSFSFCIFIETKGLNGTAFWTLNGQRVNATDHTVPIVDIFNYTEPECLDCNCLKGGLGAKLIQESASPEQNMSAFIISLHNWPEGDIYLKRKALCYYADVTLSLLVIRTVQFAPMGIVDVGFTVADSMHQTETKSLIFVTEYEQVDNDAVLYPLNVSVKYLSSGASDILLCRATTAGNSSLVLSWAVESRDNPVLSFPMAVTNYSENSLEVLCKDQTGVFQLVLLPEYGRDLELDQEGATFLLHRAALLICNANTSSSGVYSCFVNSSKTTDNVVVLAVEPADFSVPYSVVIMVAVIFLVFCMVVVLVMMLCFYCQRSSKRLALRMVPWDHPSSSSRQPQVSATTNQLFFEESLEVEFPRDKLQLISVLGEGQFGQVWKAVAEGICPQDVNRNTVAVKTLKPNARWSDKDDLQSELDIMLSIDPHPNIINLLRMCSETDTEPLYILMEFAQYGSLKDYLKKLVTGKLKVLYPRRPLTSSSSSSSCSCSCHQSCLGDVRDVNSQTHRAHPNAVASLSLDSCEHDPVEAAHAARLFNLLEPNYSTSGSISTTSNYRQTDESSHGSSETLSDYVGRCAYHPCMHDDNRYHYDYSRNDYYNSYYNYRGGDSVVSPNLTGGSLHDHNNEDGHFVGKYACICENNGTYRDDNKNEYSNISSTGCSYCAPESGTGLVPCCERHSVSCGEAGPVLDRCVGMEHRKETDRVSGHKRCTKCFCQSLKNSDSKDKLGYFEFLDYACQISRGMEHLENMKCVHRDLAARNVLIAENFVLKIGDFGLTRDLSGEDYYRKRSAGKIPARWMAVESLTDMKHTPKSDVWSYGVVLWEILTYGDLPYGKTPMASSIQTLASFLKVGHRLARPATCTSAIYDVMRVCWHTNPEQRPTFSDLAEAFRLVLQKSPDHHNRSIEEVPNHPTITQSETKIFHTLLRISSCDYTRNTSEQLSQVLHDTSTEPSYVEAVRNSRGVISSACSDLSTTEHAQSIQRNATQSAQPLGCTGTADQSQEVELGCSSGTEPIKQDYLTICRRDEGTSHLPEENQNYMLSVSAECKQSPDLLHQDNTPSTDTLPSLWSEVTEIRNLMSSPKLSHNVGSREGLKTKPRSNWKPRETEV